MISRPQRLRADRDFQRIFRGSRPIRGRHFTVRIVPNRLPHARYGFIVATAVSKRATVRNRLKRRLRAIYRRHPLASRHDLAVIAHKGATDQPFAQIQAEILSLTHQALHAPPRRRPHHHLPKKPVA